MSFSFNFDAEQGPVCEQGATFHAVFTWKLNTGTLIDVSLYSAKMQVRKNFGKPVIVELSTTNERIYYDSNGSINLLLTAAETALLDAGKYIYDLELTLLSDTTDVTRLLQGTFVVTPQVTL